MTDVASDPSSSGPKDANSKSLKQATFEEELENLACRFIVNLPANELTSIERIGFQVEQAHWFYLDFLCPQNPQLPQRSLRKFTEELLHVASLAVPLIQLYTSSGPSSLSKAYSQFMEYKTRVPVCGAILLSEDWTKCILVKGWGKGASWTFPKGKINQDEPERDCAIREVREETGFDASDLLPENSKDYFELTQREQKIRLYVIPGVPESTQMETQTRREISRIEWFKLGDLPTAKKPKSPAADLGGKFYMVMPFVMRLRRWIQANKRTHPRRPIVSTPTPAPKEAAPGQVSLDALFGTVESPKATPTNKPGLISLPPSAMRQMAQTAKAASARQLRQQSPSINVDRTQDEESKKKLLLTLLQGSQPPPPPVPPQPLPAPPSHMQTQRHCVHC
ncbi:decapping enzyme [Malassezia pachydermatis]|uniref:Decapping enzyme n=1 Tax=Malassezia pachydermatis TaxID=77020 RepID=A0A0M9VN64_9BASI|nr:decapping enzyme [Malassezia pachydermatis]KOS13012.1 decapping enzyme [Malassezia pachydermatis]